MSEMSSEARTVLDAGRRAHDPDARRKARVREALRARIAAGDAPATLRTRVPRWAALAVAVVLVGLVAAWFVTRPRVAPSPPPRVSALAPLAAPPAPVAPAAPAALATPPVDATPAPAIAAPAPRVVPADTDTLAEELRILQGVRRALAQGRSDEALRAVQAHARRFPSGQLVEEREALRATALCAGDDHDAARRALDVFTRRFPRSPQLPRLQRACAGRSP